MSLLFPLVFWDTTKPEHPITCVMKGENYIVTGAATGELCYWRAVDDDTSKSGARATAGTLRRFMPRALLMREDFSGVTAVTRCLLSGTDNIFSANAEGFLTRWLPSGGNCFTSLSMFPFAPTKLLVALPPPPSMIAERTDPPPPYLVVAGDSTDVQVVNVLNMQLAKVLKHRSKVVGICVTPPSFNRQSYVMTLSELGGLYLWDLNQPNEPAYAVRLTKLLGIQPPAAATAAAASAPSGPVTAGSKNAAAASAANAAVAALTAPPSTPVCVAVSNDGSRFLIVMKYHWVVASFKDFKMESPLMTSAQAYPSDVHWIGGAFLLDSERVVLWTSTGYIDAYVLVPVSAPKPPAPTVAAAAAPVMPMLDLASGHGSAYAFNRTTEGGGGAHPGVPTPGSGHAAVSITTPGGSLLHAQPSGFFNFGPSGAAAAGAAATSTTAAGSGSGHAHHGASAFTFVGSSHASASGSASAKSPVPQANGGGGHGGHHNNNSSNMHDNAEPVVSGTPEQPSFAQIHNPKLVTMTTPSHSKAHTVGAVSVDSSMNGAHSTTAGGDAAGSPVNRAGGVSGATPSHAAGGPGHEDGTVPPTPTARPVVSPAATASLYTVTPHLLAKLEKGDEKDQFQWMYGAPEGEEKVVVVEVDGDDVWQGDNNGSLYHWRVPRSARQKQKPPTLYGTKSSAAGSSSTQAPGGPVISASTTTAAAGGSGGSARNSASDVKAAVANAIASSKTEEGKRNSGSGPASSSSSGSSALVKKEEERPLGKDKKLLPVQVLSIGDGFSEAPRSAFQLESHHPAPQPRPTIPKSVSDNQLGRTAASLGGAPIVVPPGAIIQPSIAIGPVIPALASLAPNYKPPSSPQPTAGTTTAGAKPGATSLQTPQQTAGGARPTTPNNPPAGSSTASGSRPAGSAMPTGSPAMIKASTQPPINPSPAPGGSKPAATTTTASPAPALVKPVAVTPSPVGAGGARNSGTNLHPSNLQVKTDAKSLVPVGTPSPGPGAGASSSAAPVPHSLARQPSSHATSSSTAASAQAAAAAAAAAAAKQQRTIHVYEDEHNPCTASVMYKAHDLETTVLLFRGYRRGEIRAYKLLSQDYKEELKLLGHRDEVTCMIAITRDESPVRKALLLSASKDCTLRLWDVAGEKLHAKFRCMSPVLSLHWFPPYPLSERALAQRIAKIKAKRQQLSKLQAQRSTSGASGGMSSGAHHGDETHMKLSDFTTPTPPTLNMTGGLSASALGAGGFGSSPLSAAVGGPSSAPAASSALSHAAGGASGGAGGVHGGGASGGANGQLSEDEQLLLEDSYEGQPGDLVFAVCQDRSVYVFSILTLQPLQILRGHDSMVHYVYRDRWCIAADYVITHSKRGTVYVWVLSTGHLERCFAANTKECNYFLKSRGLLAQRSQVFVSPSTYASEHGTNHASLAPPATPRNVSSGKLTSMRPFGLERISKSPASELIHVVPFPGPAQHLHVSVYVLNLGRLLDALRSKYSALRNASPEEFREIAKRGGEVQAYNCMLSALFDWNVDHELDRMTKEHLEYFEPYPPRSFGTITDKGRAMTILFPYQSAGLGRWRFDSYFSAYQSISLSTVCMALLTAVGHPSQQVYFSRIVAHYSVILPDTMRHYVEPDVEVLAEYSLNESEEIYTVARLLLQGVLERSKPSRRVEMVKKWSSFYTTRDQTEVRVINTPTPAAHLRLVGATVGPGYDLNVTGGSAIVMGSGPSGMVSGGMTAAGGVAYDAPVSDRELMAALVLCLIGVFDSGRKDREEKKRAKMEAERAQIAAREAAAAAAAAKGGEQEGEEVVDYVDGDKIAAAPKPTTPDKPKPAPTATATPAKPGAAPSGSGSGSGSSKTPEPAKGSSASSSSTAAVDNDQEREGLDERQELEQEKARIRRELEKLKKDSEQGQALDAIEAVSAFVTNTLLRQLNVIKGVGNESPRDVVRCALAAELLGKGFPLWHAHVPDLVDLIRRLHNLSMVKQTSLAAAAHRALLQAGKAAPKHFVSCMGREALNPKNSGRGRSGALLAIVALVRKYPVSLARVLPSTVQIILRCLDPSDPELRRNLLHSSTAALHVLVQKYPMTSFHQKSQRFAVGTGIAQQSVIIIYDLRTAIKWRILEGHRGNISAISFNAQGNCLVSYSADENPPAFCVWNTGTAGLLSGLWRIQGRCIRIYKLHPIKANRKFALSEHLENIKITWVTVKRVRLRREDGSICNFNV